MDNLTTIALIVVVALVAQGTIFYFYTRANDNKRKAEDALKRIEAIEKKAQKTRLPFTAAENIENVTAIIWRQKREIELDILHGEQRVRMAKAKLAELDRALEYSQSARANGQQRGNGN